MRVAMKITPTPEELDHLNAIVADPDSPKWRVSRARAILMAADGIENKTIAGELGVGEHTVARWRRRSAEDGVDGITCDAPRSGRPPEVTERVEDEVVRLGKNNYRGRSIRSISRKVGASLSRGVSFPMLTEHAAATPNSVGPHPLAWRRSQPPWAIPPAPPTAGRA